MAPPFDRNDLPGHLFSVPEVDVTPDLVTDPLAGPTVRLAVWTLANARHEGRVHEDLLRQTLLIPPDAFAQLFAKLDSFGNALDGIGKPSVWGNSEGKHWYSAVHEFTLPFTKITAEPLVFRRSSTVTSEFVINPDLWLYLELEPRTLHIWWDPRRGMDVLIRHVIDERLEIIEIRRDYLLKYLQARQRSLLIAQYHQLLLMQPTPESIGAFTPTTDLIMGTSEQHVKALLQNWGLQRGTDYLQRRLHLWIEIPPPAFDPEHVWKDKPPFDVQAFTLPTSVGPVAPGRWAHHVEEAFPGPACDFMDPVYFRQQVLTKYEAATGCEVHDDGSVICGGFWSLNRSTSRLGNELMRTAIGDFAEGVPYDEWPHWRQYAVEPPSHESVQAIIAEPPIPEVVNNLMTALEWLNGAATDFGTARHFIVDPVWSGSRDSLAARQLKWVYPAAAPDDEFLKRATLTSTLIIDGLRPAALRQILQQLGSGLHQTFDKNSKPLGSRNLLQRLSLIAVLIDHLQPTAPELSSLVELAESDKPPTATEHDLQAEVHRLYNQVRQETAPLAFLYDLRVHGGLAHQPNPVQVGLAATNLGLPERNWHRTDYLHLLRLLSQSLASISNHFAIAAEL